MGIIKKLFGNSSELKEEKVLPCIPLDDIQQLQHIKEKSNTKPQLIFKHSTRCGISIMVLRQFTEAYTLTEKEADLYYLDLLSYRAISNEVSELFQIMHESPQLLVVKNGVVVAHASHGAINSVDLNAYI